MRFAGASEGNGKESIIPTADSESRTITKSFLFRESQVFRVAVTAHSGSKSNLNVVLRPVGFYSSQELRRMRLRLLHFLRQHSQEVGLYRALSQALVSSGRSICEVRS